MSFFTTLMFCRPTKPPVITGKDLAAFIREFHQLGVASLHGKLNVELKFGASIDADDEPATWAEPIAAGLGVTRELHWDVTTRCGTLSEAATFVAAYHEPIYRGYVELGVATTEVCAAVQRIGSPENTVDLTLDSWSMELGPCFSGSLAGDESFMTGWMCLNLSGYGYLYPWTFAELVRRAESEPGIIKVMELCRQSWPVEPVEPDEKVRQLRASMEGLWPYPNLDEPLGWCWGLSET